MIKKIIMITKCLIAIIFGIAALVDMHLKYVPMLKESLLYIFVLIVGSVIIVPLLLLAIMILYCTITEKGED